MQVLCSAVIFYKLNIRLESECWPESECSDPPQVSSDKRHKRQGRRCEGEAWQMQHNEKPHWRQNKWSFCGNSSGKLLKSENNLSMVASSTNGNQTRSSAFPQCFHNPLFLSTLLPASKAAHVFAEEIHSSRTPPSNWQVLLCSKSWFQFQQLSQAGADNPVLHPLVARPCIAHNLGPWRGILTLCPLPGTKLLHHCQPLPPPLSSQIRCPPIPFVEPVPQARQDNP